MKKSSTPQAPYREMLKNLRDAMHNSMNESQAIQSDQQPEIKQKHQPPSTTKPFKQPIASAENKRSNTD